MESNYMPLKSRIENFFDSHRDPGNLIVLNEAKVRYWVHPSDARYYAVVIESKSPIPDMTEIQYSDMSTIKKHLEYRYGKSNVYLEKTESGYFRIYFFEDFEAEVSKA